MNATRLVVLSIGCAALLATMFAAVRAQGNGIPRDASSSCLTSIPDSALRAVVVYVEAELVDSTDRPMLPSLDLLAQEVADSVRASLGAAARELPNGEPAVTWRALGTDLVVVVRRDGRIASRLPTSELTSSTDINRPDTSAAHLLALGIAAVAGDHLYFTVWPDEFKLDSVAFRLVLHYPLVNDSGVAAPIQARQAFALFTVRVPTEEPVTVKHQSTPKYPENFPEKGVTGDLIMQFIVDTTGRAEMVTVKDLWPPSRPRLTGELGRYYETFRRAVIQSISRDRFEPARIGGCKVRQLVQMPFGFRVSR